jgi:hypothetical protein
MSKKLIFIGLALMLVLSSCALPGAKAAKAEQSVDAPVSQPVQPAQPAQPEPAQPVQQEPTLAQPPAAPAAPAAAEPAAAEPAVAEPQAEAPTAAPDSSGGFTFHDDFDTESDSYTEDTITTTQAVTRDQVQTEPSSVQDGILTFNIRDNETYIYKLINNSMTENAVIEAKWKSNGQSLNGVALLCRASEDFSGWYEFRMSAQGEWQFLQYDKSIRDNDPYKNPYVSIKKGQAKQKLVRVTGDNVSKFTCNGNKFAYEINGTKIYETTNTKIKGGGLVGIGVMSSTYLPVILQFDYLDVKQP